MLTKYLTSQLAAALDADLLGPHAGFTLEQLMELAGLSVAQAIHMQWGSNSKKSRVFVISGPGNNGGDGLVCARHLKLFGFEPIVFYPKRSSKVPFYNQLLKQLEFFKIPVISFKDQWKQYLDNEITLCVVDALFGFSFKPPIKEPFGEILMELKKYEKSLPIVSVDIPSGWDVDTGPLDSSAIVPKVLVSLTVPKLCANFIDPSVTIHYVGGRFVPPHFAEKYGFSVFNYPRGDQVMRF